MQQLWRLPGLLFWGGDNVAQTAIAIILDTGPRCHDTGYCRFRCWSRLQSAVGKAIGTKRTKLSMGPKRLMGAATQQGDGWAHFAR